MMRRENETPIPPEYQGELYPPGGINQTIKLNLKVTPVSNAYRALEGTKKVGKGLKKGAYYGAVGTAGLIGQALSAARQGIGALGQGISTAYQERNRSLERFEARVDILPTYQADSSQHSPNESGTQSSGFSRRSESDLRPNRTSDEGLFSRFGKRLGNASTAARRRLDSMTKKRKPVEEEEVTMLSGFADSSEHSPEQSGSQSFGFSRRSEPSRFQKLRTGAGELATGTL